MVDKISWQKAGRIAEPGRYMFKFGWLTVTADDVAVWQLYPDAVFTLVELPPSQRTFDDDESSEFHLGTFELPLSSS